eukprot:TRINITY_DN7033_c0_g1_i2.p1 TRINITY_DN7033_c0_g1~~TRINITY_DN7033_c0_g1_i2.p1  ORF type:complete len:154 (-),score=9.84 TRINITY_DN7033_c0_g1_i2:260-721(-)
MFTPIRSYAATMRHGKKIINIGSLLKKRLPENLKYTLIAGEVGFQAGDHIYAADLGIGQYDEEYEDKVLPKPPKLLVEIMSHYNYGGQGEVEFCKKVNDALKNGSSVVWVVHPGVRREPIGVQVMTDGYDAAKPFLKDSELLNDAGIGLNIFS